jgi:hypothetical protein
MQVSHSQNTRERYFRLPVPNNHIIIATPRLQDAAQLCEILNDPRVYTWILDPPFPYTMDDAISWLTKSKAEADAIWSELEQASVECPNDPPKIVGGCPVSSILEENADGSYTFLGACGIDRHKYEDVIDVEERARLVHDNNARPVGDPDIIWRLGCTHLLHISGARVDPRSFQTISGHLITGEES